MQSTSVPLRRFAQATTTDQILRVITFEVAGNWLALPMTVVLKVIPCPSITAASQGSVGIVDLGDRTATVIDLQQRLLPDSPTSASWRFLILTQTRQGELCGIPVNQMPNLMEISPETVRALPEAYRRSDPLGIASHVAALGSRQIFLLGMQQQVENSLAAQARG